MVDITVDSASTTSMNQNQQARNLVWTDKDTGYMFFIDLGLEVQYRKTTDAGATWGDKVTIKTGNVLSLAVWYDKWTKDDTGNIIHITFIDFTDANLAYNSLDTSDDSLGGEVTAFDGASIDTGGWTGRCISIVKSKGGNVYVGGWIDNDGENAFAKATQSPATSFSSRTSMADGNEVDRIMFLPGNETDSNDIWCFYQDVSADEMTLKVYDDSANSWSESSAIDSITENANFFNWDCMERHSDNNGLLVLWNAHQSSTADLAVHDVTNITTFSQKTDVISNTSARAQTGMMINQQNDDIYVAYGTGTTTGSIIYKLSTDSGSTWGTETNLAVTKDDHLIIFGGTSVDSEGGRWMPTWYNDDLNDLLTNKDNSILIAGAPTIFTVSVSDTLSLTDTFTRGVWTLGRTFTDTFSISDSIAIFPTRTRKIIRDTLFFIKNDLLNNVTDPDSAKRPSNSKFVMSSYPSRHVHYPLVTIKVTNIGVIRTGAQSSVQDVLLNLEVRIWARNEKEKEEIYTDIINRLNDIQLTGKGTAANNLHEFTILSSIEIDEPGEGGAQATKSRILNCQYQFFNIL